MRRAQVAVTTQTPSQGRVQRPRTVPFTPVTRAKQSRYGRETAGAYVAQDLSGAQRENCMFQNSEELLKYVTDEGVEFVDVRFVDLPGIEQHFTVPVSSFGQDVFDNG